MLFIRLLKPCGFVVFLFSQLTLNVCSAVYQRTFSHARTVESGTAVRGTCRPTLCTTAPAVRSSRPQPRPRHKTNPRSPTPMSASAPFHSATRAVQVPAHWRSTCALTVVRVICMPNTQRVRTLRSNLLILDQCALIDQFIRLSCR